jgi:Raf kinase inhibitor-like YbhB/YbcL family protein
MIGAFTLLTACAGGDGRTLDPPTFPLPVRETTAPSEPAELPRPTPAAALRLIAPWAAGGSVPERYTCDDVDLAPPLSWTDVPAGTQSLALTVVDPDANDYVHWIVFDLDPSLTGLSEGDVPAGAVQWPNSAGAAAYRGPCPPPGQDHRYVFTLYALNQQLRVADDASAAEVISDLMRIALDQSSVTGRFARTG